MGEVIARRARSDVRGCILRALHETPGAHGANWIASRLSASGFRLQPRSVRHYLMELDEQGLTRMVSRRTGREITARGRQAALSSAPSVPVEPVASVMEQYCYRMTFDVHSGRGSLVTNVSFVDPGYLGSALREIQLATDRGISVGRRIVTAAEGESIGEQIVPDGMWGIGTVCSVSLSGILQKQGIPVRSRFAGLLDVHDRRFTGFRTRIDYGGTTLDPLEIFIQADMTRVREYLLRGSGIICASFREVPAVAVDQVRQIEKRASAHGLGGILAMGYPGQPLFDVPVTPGFCGMVVAGGLNPIASAREAGIRLSVQSLAGLEDASKFVTVREAMRRT